MQIYLDNSKEPQGQMEIDFYTPISIKFSENDMRPRELLQYRMINKESSLIEFSINSNSGKIVEVTFVSINKIVKEAYTNVESYEMDKANPKIDLSIFENEIIVTDELEYTIFQTNDSIIALANKSKPIKRKIEMSSLMLFVDVEYKLVGVGFYNFTNSMWEDLQEAIQYANK